MGGTTLPKISIVTPSYNQGQFIEETILSIKNQDYPNIEHIVVDGGSIDNTIDILRKYEGTYNLIWTSEPDNGQADAINKGFRKADGDVLAWINSDDFYMPGTFQTVADFLEKHKDIDCVYGDINRVDENSRVLDTIKSIPFQFKMLLYGGCLIPQPTFFFRRRVIEAVGYLDTRLKYQMDYEWFVRIGSQKFKFANIPKTLACFRFHVDSKTIGQQNEFFQFDKQIKRMYRDKIFCKDERIDDFYTIFLKYLYRFKALVIRAITRGQLIPFRTKLIMKAIAK